MVKTTFALAEDQRSVSGTHVIEITTAYNPSSRPLWAPLLTRTCSHTNTQVHTIKNNQNNLIS